MTHPALVGDWRIHTPEDGRGPRVVYLNGNKIDGVVYADTLRGIVRAVQRPFKIVRGNYLAVRKYRGEVVVLPA